MTRPAPTVAPAIRDYRAGDFERLFEIDQACFPRGIAYSRSMLRWFLSAPAICLIAEVSGEIGAFILADSEAPQGQIITLDVLTAHRRSGIGSLLLLEAERRLYSAGVREVTLETATNNHAAIAFWQKHGYRTEGVLKNYYLDRLDAFQMRKGLPAPAPTTIGRPVE